MECDHWQVLVLVFELSSLLLTLRLVLEVRIIKLVLAFYLPNAHFCLFFSDSLFDDFLLRKFALITVFCHQIYFYTNKLISGLD